MGERKRNATTSSGRWLAFGLAVSVLLAGCQPDGPGQQGEPGALRLLFTSGAAATAPADDVEAIRFEVLDLTGALVASATLAVRSDQPHPADPGGTPLRGADAFFTIRPGAYRVVATPLRADGLPSEDCARAEGLVTVASGRTAELVLVMVCGAAGSGAIDVVGVLQHTPVLTALRFDPSKFVRTCQRLVIRAQAFDADGDTLTFSWAVTSSPAGASFELNASGPAALFASETPGAYELRVSVADPGGLGGSLLFPVYVSGAQSSCFERDQDGDGVPDAVDNCPLVSNAGQADDDGNGIGDACEATPQTFEFPGRWPSQIAATLDRNPRRLTGPADLPAFLDWAARSPAEDRELVRAEIAAASANDEVAAALGQAILVNELADHSMALVALSVLGEMRNPTGARFLASYARRPLPKGAPSDHGDVPAETAIAILHAKAISGLGYMRTLEADQVVLELASKHPSKVVRAEAIRTFLFNHDRSEAAAKLLQAAVRREELRYIDRVYRLPGEGAQTFDARLAAFLEKHPDAAAPDPELGQATDPGTDGDPIPNPGWDLQVNPR